VCVNYHDKAIFTFWLDGKFCLKAAVLPLQNLEPVERKEDVVDEM